ncbi:MAG: zinc-binding dehydrogenase [Dehalococcoidia bacterium]
MRAAVLRDRKLTVGEVPEPASPGPGQVLVETIACGICGSDVHMYQHIDRLVEEARQAGTPSAAAGDLVMGHEFSARVLEAGAGVDNVQPGDAIVAIPIMMTEAGLALVGYSSEFPGGYGEKMLLLGAVCYKVPENVDPRYAALTEPMSVGTRAVNRSGIEEGESAIVLGCGPIGLGTIAALRIMGAGPIVAADPSARRRELALHMGAAAAVDPREEPAIAAWQRVDGRKSLVIFEASGARGLIAQAMEAAPQEGRILVVGVCMEPDTITPLVGINKELTITFALGARPDEFKLTLDRIAEGKIDVASIVTDEIGIAGVPQAFAALLQPDAYGKILVRPQLG